MSLAQVRAEWFGNIRNDLLAGTVVALGPHPRGDRLLDHRRGRSESGALRLILHRRGHLHRRRPTGDDLRRHRRDGAGDGDARAGAWAAIPPGDDPADRGVSDHRRSAEARLAPALRLALGGDRLRQRARHPDLHGAITGVHRLWLAGLRDGCGRRWRSSTSSRASPPPSLRRWSRSSCSPPSASPPGCGSARWATWASCPAPSRPSCCRTSR